MEGFETVSAEAVTSHLTRLLYDPSRPSHYASSSLNKISDFTTYRALINLDSPRSAVSSFVILSQTTFNFSLGTMAGIFGKSVSHVVLC